MIYGQRSGPCLLASIKRLNTNNKTTVNIFISPNWDVNSIYNCFLNEKNIWSTFKRKSIEQTAAEINP